LAAHVVAAEIVDDTDNRPSGVIHLFSCQDLAMCDHGHVHDQHAAFGFLVDTPEVQLLVEEAQRQIERPVDAAERIEALKPVFRRLLESDGWLPDALSRPDETSRMGDGIGQYALYRAEDGSLCLFSLVIPPGAKTPVHDHLAWGLIGVYRGTQRETVYRRMDDASDATRATLAVTREDDLAAGSFYALIPPTDDIHYVETISDSASVSIHLLANDTACVWRHRFDPASGAVTPFRSGYANAGCPEEAEMGDVARRV
jgi:predicted metal-dependent enzyme (double-stranded beta helix superfamily)